MKAFRNVLFAITGYLLRIVLLGSISVIVFLGVLGSSKNIKKMILDTLAYNRFVPSVIEANKASKQTTDTIPYNDPQIYEIFTDSFPARDLQYNTELFIDSVYAWLGGTTKTIDFKIDLTRNRNQLADGLTNYAFNRLKSLPVCSTQPQEVNPLTISCQPNGYNSAEVKASYKQLLLSSESFLNKTILTGKDLPKLNDGLTIEQKFKFAPTAFKWLHRSPYIIAAVLLSFSLIYIGLSQRHRKAVSSLSSILMGAGIGLVVLPIVFDFILPNFTKSFSFNISSTGTQKILNDIFDLASKKIDILLISSGAVVALMGIALYLAERFTKPNSPYINVAKKSGVQTSIQKPSPSPKSLKGKLSVSNVPVVSSDRPANQNPKKVSENNKYRKLYSKKGL